MVEKSCFAVIWLNDMYTISGGPGGSPWWDKISSKLAGMRIALKGQGSEQFQTALSDIPHILLRMLY